jgi:superfamily II DNA or RNA helicase
VKVIRTKFGAQFWPDHESDEDHVCMVPTCKLSGKRPHFHRNNYQNVKTDVLLDGDRNFLICETIWDEVVAGPHHHLIICDEIRQLDALYTMLLSHHPHTEGLPGAYVMTGRVKGQERVRIKAEIEAAKEAIIFATVAKEGMDIPAVDRIYLPSPSGNPKVTQQKIGRGTRIHEGKADIIVFDFFDVLVDIFRKQFRKRRFQCYDQLGLEVDLGSAA